MHPLEHINKINACLDKILENKKYDNDASDIFLYYSKDFCILLSLFYPSSTVMIDKTYKKCALLINGVLYNSKGIANMSEYKIASAEDINYIRLGFNELSDGLFNVIYMMLDDNYIEVKTAYTLRKNSNYLS